VSVHVKVFVAILIAGVAGIFGAKYALPKLRDALQRETSDASQTHGSIVIGVDNWVGYFPLCSPEMERRMRRAGYALRCEDDKADYAARVKKIADGKLDLAVATVDSYVLNGARHDFPAAIVAVIDESRGGDAIVARRSVVDSLDALKQRADIKIAYTPASPSEHLLKSIATHFDIPALRERKGAWRVPADGSPDALTKLQAKAVDVAVLWEPDVSRALQDPAYIKLIGTEDTDKLIVDVLLASRRLIQEKPELIRTLLDEYFQTLHDYSADPQRLRSDLRKATGLDAQQVEPMLAGVAWATLNDNGALWFGVTPSGLPAQEGLVEAIRGAVDVLLAVGDFGNDPLPDRDPYRITNRSAVSDLYLAQAGIAPGAEAAADSLTRAFDPLDDAGWAKLKDVGTLKVEPIGFQSGTATLDDDGRAVVARMTERLRHYPHYRIVVRGHTAVSGDAQANLKLSQERASAVAADLLDTWHLDPDRVRAVGYGGSRPLPRQPNESERAWGYRLPRVEVSLVAEPY
jgi:outer membrane protein OmpA-like peptidoglycan-associated protein